MRRNLLGFAPSGSNPTQGASLKQRVIKIIGDIFMKWILYLSNNTHNLVAAFCHHGGNGKPFNGILFPEVHSYQSDKISLTHKEQINLLEECIDINKNGRTDEFVFASHSEFFLLALRHAVWSNKIDSKDLEIRWLDGLSDRLWVSLLIHPSGGIEHWPTNMFSETEKLLGDLMGPKPNKIVN